MKNFTIVRGFLDNRKRSLIIDDYIQYENKDLKSNPFTVFKKEDIKGIRYGIHFIKGYKFYIGREYQIYVRNNKNEELKIYFKLFYGRKLQEKHQLYIDIIDKLWENFFNGILQDYLEKFNKSEDFILAGIQIFKDKIVFDKTEISFQDLAIKKYQHYFMIFSKEDRYKNKMLYYLKDKDAVILLNLLSTIINNE